MGSCTRRHFLLSTCFLQMITVIERQVFDFLGYMWAPICVNFFHIIFVIFGFYGAYHFRIKYIITYLIWNFVWIAWNSFLICFYLNVGELDRDSDLLNLGTGSVSWFEVNGYGCKPTYPTNITSDDPFRPIRPERVDDCLLDYHLVEVTQSGIQCALAVFGIFGAILISTIFLDEDDRLKHVNKKSKHRQSLYSIEFGPSVDTIRSRTDTILGFEDDNTNDRDGSELSPKPMTPRRVKRRSVMARGTNSRQSGTSRRSSHKHNTGSSSSNSHTNAYSHNSMRHSRRKYQQNPVTKILDQQQDHLKKQQKHYGVRDISTYSKQLPPQPTQQQFGSFQRKDPTLSSTNLQMLNQDVISDANITTNNILASGSLTKSNNNHYHSFRKNIPPDPIYYNINGQAGMLQQNWQTLNQSPIVSDESPASPTTTTMKGHFNPTYQHSITNLNDVENVDEMYNNRPPSVRSSYSNFHGARPLSTAFISNPGVTENVFAGLPGTMPHHHHHRDKQQQHHQYSAPSTPPLYASNANTNTNSNRVPMSSGNFATSQPQNIPFTKRTASRESIRSMAFLNSGPPAYNLNYHTPPDSETTM